MGQALYRQYRPKSLADVVGQEHITTTILHALKQGKLAHAYLFTGPRGVGKTSIARILAHEINGLPYDDDAMHLDIIEIDAASNRRIDEIRELRDKVNIAPSVAQYKVYIIDEVHMLTREAFNALLKTLEEPPAHAVFILATTESHKLPETIVSRTQRFIFKPVAMEQVTAHLKTIASKENIVISDEALGLVAAYGEGSFRDSISLLDQTRGHDGDVTADYIRMMIGLPTTEAIDSLLHAVSTADAVTLSKLLHDVRGKGFAAPQVAKYLGQRLRQEVLAGNGRAGVFELMGQLLEVPVAHDPDSFLELTLLTHALAGHLPVAAKSKPAYQSAPPTAAAISESVQPDIATAAASAGQPPVPAPSLTINNKDRTPRFTAPPTVEQQTVPNETLLEVADERKLSTVDDSLWPEILNSLKKSHNTLYGIARNARPVFYEDGLELGLTFDFHRKRLSENKNKEVVIAIIKQLTGRELSLKCILVSKDTPIVAHEPAQAPKSPAINPIASRSVSAAPDLNAISSIFGGAEVLER